jgi:hypothetical protein
MTNCEKRIMIDEGKRKEFKKFRCDSKHTIRDPYTGNPWKYNDEITKLFDDMIVNKNTN